MPRGFKQEYFHDFPIPVYVRHVPPRASHLRPKWHNLNELCRGLQCEDIYQISKQHNLNKLGTSCIPNIKALGIVVPG